MVNVEVIPDDGLPVTVESCCDTPSRNTVSLARVVWGKFRALAEYPLVAYTWLHASAGSASCEVVSFVPALVAAPTLG